jgi:hypothetical protein
MSETIDAAKNKPKFQVFPEPLTYDEKRVREITSRLNELGIKVFAPSFPFAMHHRFYRVKYRPEGRHSAHHEVSVKLRAWADGRQGQDDYIWQAVCGGLLLHFKKQPNDKSKLTPDIIASLEAVNWGDDFEKFLVNGQLNSY